jgi:hypothetical protein
MKFINNTLASVLNGGTFGLAVYHKGSSSGPLYNSGVSHCFKQSVFYGEVVDNGQQRGKYSFRLHRYDPHCPHASDHASRHSLAITASSRAAKRGGQPTDGRRSIPHEFLKKLHDFG